MNNHLNHEINIEDINIEDIENILAYIQKISPHRELHTLFKSTINHTYGVGLPGENVKQKTKEIEFHYVITRGEINVLFHNNDRDCLNVAKNGKLNLIPVGYPNYAAHHDDTDSVYKRIHTSICRTHKSLPDIKARRICFINNVNKFSDIHDLAWHVLEEYINTPFKNTPLDPYLDKVIMILLKKELTYMLETLNSLSPSSENGVNALHNDTIHIEAYLYDVTGENSIKEEYRDFNFNYVITNKGIYLIHLERTFNNTFTILEDIKNYICHKHREIKNIHDKKVYRSFNLDEMEAQLRDEIIEIEERQMEEHTKEYDKLTKEKNDNIIVFKNNKYIKNKKTNTTGEIKMDDFLKNTITLNGIWNPYTNNEEPKEIKFDYIITDNTINVALDYELRYKTDLIFIRTKNGIFDYESYAFEQIYNYICDKHHIKDKECIYKYYYRHENGEIE